MCATWDWLFSSLDMIWMSFSFGHGVQANRNCSWSFPWASLFGQDAGWPQVFPVVSPDLSHVTPVKTELLQPSPSRDFCNAVMWASFQKDGVLRSLCASVTPYLQTSAPKNQRADRSWGGWILHCWVGGRSFLPFWSQGFHSLFKCSWMNAISQQLSGL